MTWATLSIDRRFCGPPGSGNGGYTAGRLAALTGDPAEITLRRPPPLETEMRVERAGPRLLLMHGEDLIAEAQKTVVELAIPECPSLHEARRASTGYPGLDRHPFPGCFVCGPQRAADGMGSVVAMTFAIDHLDFFGLRQVGYYLRGLSLFGDAAAALGERRSAALDEQCWSCAALTES